MGILQYTGIEGDGNPRQHSGKNGQGCAAERRLFAKECPNRQQRTEIARVFRTGKFGLNLFRNQPQERVRVLTIILTIAIEGDLARFRARA